MSIAPTVAALGPLAALADPALLEPVADREIRLLLERNFTLPLSLGSATLPAAERQDLVLAEVARLRALLVARGFLEARIDTDGRATEEDPVRLRPVPGPLYRFGEVRIDGIPADVDPALAGAIEALRSGHSGEPALGAVVDDLVSGLLYAFRQAAYADAALRDVAFDLNRKAGTADLVVTVDPGQPMRLGVVRFDGSLRMTAEEAQALLPFRTGDPYSLTAVEALYRALNETDVFRRIRIETDVDPDAPGVIDLSVRLRDRAELPPLDSQPRILLATILYLALLQTVRMTKHWSRRGLRLAMIVPAVLLLGGSALEMAHRLYSFLTQ